MNLYRIDTPNGPVTDWFGPCLIRSYRDAMDHAHEVATNRSERVEVTRISGSGTLKRIAVVHPGRGDIGARAARATRALARVDASRAHARALRVS